MANPSGHLIVPLDIDEIACRIVEGTIGRLRPEGLTPKEALLALAEIDGESVDALRQAALRVISYVAQQMSELGGRLQ